MFYVNHVAADGSFAQHGPFASPDAAESFARAAAGARAADRRKLVDISRRGGLAIYGVGLGETLVSGVTLCRDFATAPLADAA